jgi:hypothetical protein
MKTIEVTDEMYDFLINTSKELNTQDHRGTAMPYFYQIQTKEMVAVPVGNGTVAWHFDGTLLDNEEDIKNAIYELKDWDSENDDDYYNLTSYDIENILEDNGWSKVNYDMTDVYMNSFLTEKACKEHIKNNKYHYNQPIDFLSYASRNPELEMLLKFLTGLTGGKLHK